VVWLESKVVYRVSFLFRILVLTTTRSSKGGFSAKHSFSRLCTDLSGKHKGISKEQVAQKLNRCLALNDIREAMGWTGVLFITSVPLDLYSNSRGQWKLIWEEYKKNKETLDDVVTRNFGDCFVSMILGPMILGA
jgi:hypothetical protein